MKLKPKITVADHFADIEDPRVERTRQHKLIDIITIALRVRSRLRRETLLQRCLTICAVICGGEGWTDIETYGKRQVRVVEAVFRVTQWYSESRYIFASVRSIKSSTISAVLSELD